MTTPSRARLQELLATEATQRLTAAEAAELDALLAAFPDQDPDDFELAAAAVHLTLADTSAEMPTALAEKLYLTAVAVAPAPTTEPARPRGDRSARPAWAAWGGWAVAAGLAGVLAFTLATKPKVVEVPVEVVKEVPKEVVREVVKASPEPTLEQRREEFRKEGKTFAQAKDGLSASVAWSGPKQDGVLEVSGLPVTAGAKEQYQLWVIDAARGKEAKPISAGVFDVKDGKTLVRVRASLPVGEAAAFAISKEPRGGGVQPTEVLLVIPAKAG